MSAAAAAVPATPLERDDVDAGTLVSARSSENNEKGEKLDGEVQSPEGCAEAGVSSVPPPAFVEGGLKGWLNVAGAFLTLFVTFGFTNSWGVLQNYYKVHQFADQSPGTIAWIGSIQLWAMFTMGVVSGPLYDRGFFRYLMAGGSALYIFSLFMVTVCKAFWQTILAQGFGMGIGMGLMFLPSISVLSQNFQRRRSFAMGIAIVGGSVGGVCFPIFLNNMLASHPFDEALRAVAYLILALLVIINAIMSARPPLHAKGSRPPSPSPKVLFSEPRYAFAVTGAFFVALGLFMPFFFLQVFTTSKGLSRTISFYSLSILNAASILGRTIPNALADRYGGFNLLVPICACTCILVFAMFGAGSTGGAVTFAILYGFFSGGYVSLISPVFVSMANNVSEIGIRMGMAFVCVGLAALAGSPIAGALLVRTPNFVAPIIFSGVTVGIGTVFLVLARAQQVKVKGTWKV